MRRVGSILLVLGFGLGLASTAVAGDADPPPTCITSWPEARYVVGYDHIVHLYNACDRDAVCTVSTNVNPSAQTVSVPKSTHVEVVTFRGSPASKFSPRVACVMQ